MKFDKQKAFPYPVLRPGNNDYLDSEFQTNVIFEKDESSKFLKMTVEFAISSDEIMDEITRKSAAFACMVSCRDTYYRQLFRTNDSRFESAIEASNLRGEVRVDSYVIAQSDIPEFYSDEINKEFGEGPYSYEAGDVLAQDETKVFFMDREVFKPVTSVFDLAVGPTLSKHEWNINFEGDHVVIQVSSAMKEVIDSARNTTGNKAILINSIYFTAVVAALQKLKDAEGDYDNYKWSMVFRAQLHNKGIELVNHDSYMLANMLMDYPIRLLDAYVFKAGE